MSPPVVVTNLSESDAQQMKIIFEGGGASVSIVPGASGRLTLVATYPDQQPQPSAPTQPATTIATPQPSASTPPLPTTGGDFIGRVLQVCTGEWEFFGRQQYDLAGNAVVVGHKELEPNYAQRIGRYFDEGTGTTGVDGTNTDMAWSAAFISWVMRKSEAGSRFRYSTLHSVYIYQAIRDRLSGSDAGFWAYRLNEYRPMVGDLLCWARQPGIDYDSQAAGNYHGHCDIVVAVEPDKVWVIGGNIGNSVTKRPISLGPNGFMSPISIGGETLFSTMQCRIGVAVTQTALSTAAQVADSPGTSTSPGGDADGSAYIAFERIAWGKVVTPEFKQAVIALSKRIGCDPSHLMAAMAFESAETFSPSEKNPKSGATGLIQFMKSTAEGLGTSLQQLAAMSQIEQLFYVEKYLSPYSGRFGSLSDMYMAILYPAAIGKPEANVLFSSGSKAYSQNVGLDVNGDGYITKGEAASKVQGKLDKGLTSGLVG
ncbi:DUF2272 domain-containing protein [Mesorhizobium sp. M0715]|uniref:DUF2272 domain-containing protein n=1 Tax=Mesorhizobium sp. M0715 TaxID=2956990 RepID=UPI003335CFF3